MLSPEQFSELALRIKNSDAKAFEALFDEMHEAIYNFIYFKIGDAEASEDILQEVFVRIWENRCTLRTDVSIKGFLFTIANNMSLNMLRHRQIVIRHQLELMVEPQNDERTFEEIEAEDLKQQILENLNDLPEKPRVVFMLSRFDNLSYKEISQKLNISVKTVESHMGRALKLMRQTLEAATV